MQLGALATSPLQARALAQGVALEVRLLATSAAPLLATRAAPLLATRPVQLIAARPLGGTVCLAIATNEHVASRKSRIVGGREWVRLGAVEMGLDCLRRYLQGLPVYERIDFEKV